MEKEMNVLCPICKKILTTAYPDDTTRHIIACRACSKLIVYVPAQKYVKLKSNIPERTTISGKIIY